MDTNVKEKVQPIDEIVTVEISKDRMIGVIEFEAPKNGGKALKLHDIQKQMKDKGINAGIFEEAVKELGEKRQYNYKYIIAKGQPAQDGENAILKLNFDEEKIKFFKPKENEDGTVDFKDLNAVHNVKTGDLLASKIPATEGVDGYNVMGQPIRARRGKDVRMPKGKNTQLTADGLSLVSSVDGKLEYDGHNVYINTVYTLNGDVDSSIGNIDFLGSVVINGSVKAGYTIKAEGSVEVRGCVEEATIIAGGDILLGYGIQGGEGGKLVSGGNIAAKFIQNATVEARKDVVAEAIMHSNVAAGNSIQADTGKGTIVGGSLAATSMITAKSIGSPMGTVTKVKIGVPPTVYAQYKQLEQEVVEQTENLDKIEKSIKFLIVRSKQAKLDPEKQAMLQKLGQSRLPVVEKLEKVKKDYRELCNMLSDVKEGIIKASDTVHTGVKVTIGSTIKYIDDDVVHCTIRKIDGEIVLGL